MVFVLVAEYAPRVIAATIPRIRVSESGIQSIVM